MVKNTGDDRTLQSCPTHWTSDTYSTTKRAARGMFLELLGFCILLSQNGVTGVMKMFRRLKQELLRTEAFLKVFLENMN